MQRLVVMIDDDVIRALHLPPQITSAAERRVNGETATPPNEALSKLRASGISVDAELQRYEYALLRAALDCAEGTKTKAAEMLGLNKDKMKYLCRKYGL